MDIKDEAPSTFADVLLFALGGVERQEADGQRKMIAASKLPIQGPWAEAIALGIIQGESDGDLFYDSTLPEGWQIKRTDHSMWSDLLDDQGRRRGGVFYKAAFYDRSARWNLDRRFKIAYSMLPTQAKYAQVVKDWNDNVLFDPDVPADQDEMGRNSEEACIQWLQRNYPEWKSPAAYW